MMITNFREVAVRTMFGSTLAGRSIPALCCQPLLTTLLGSSWSCLAVPQSDNFPEKNGESFGGMRNNIRLFCTKTILIGILIPCCGADRLKVSFFSSSTFYTPQNKPYRYMLIILFSLNWSNIDQEKKQIA